MSIKRQYRTLPDYLTYSASTTQSLTNGLPLDAVITQVDLDVRVTASKAYVGVAEDAIGRLLNVLRIVGPGESAFFSVTDGRMAQWYNHFTTKVTYFDDLTSTGECHALVSINFSGNPNDPYDMTCALPANTTDKGKLSSLNLRWTCPANTVMDGGTSPSTISTAYIYVSVYELLNAPSPMFEPRMEGNDWAADQTYSDLAKKFNVPTGCFVRRVIILANDHTALSAGTSCGDIRKDDQVTRIGLTLPEEGSRRTIDITQWEAKRSSASASLFYGDQWSEAAGALSLNACTRAGGRIGQPVGVYCVDFRKYGDATLNRWGGLAGLDQRGKAPGNLYLAMTIGTNTSGDDVHLLWDEVVPSPGKAV